MGRVVPEVRRQQFGAAGGRANSARRTEQLQQNYRTWNCGGPGAGPENIAAGGKRAKKCRSSRQQPQAAGARQRQAFAIGRCAGNRFALTTLALETFHLRSRRKQPHLYLTLALVTDHHGQKAGAKRAWQLPVAVAAARGITLLFQGKDEPDPPEPPGQQPPAPVEEPPRSPQSDPPAPVREPGPTPPKRMQVYGAACPRPRFTISRAKAHRILSPISRTKARGFHGVGSGFCEPLNSPCLCVSVVDFYSGKGASYSICTSPPGSGMAAGVAGRCGARHLSR